MSRKEQLFETGYLILAALFVAALVVCNLIILKFFAIPMRVPWGGTFTFEQSVGLLPYPLTFLVTDILSEVYGRQRANRVVFAGLFAMLFTTLVIFVADAAPAGAGSPVDDATFNRVFGLSWAAMVASMAAYLSAQFLDIRLFYFWRHLTHGRHLWLRNNASTFCSQVVDTVLVVGLLCLLQALKWSQFQRLVWHGIAFKWLVALCDTPFFYAATLIFWRLFPEQMRAVAEQET